MNDVDLRVDEATRRSVAPSPRHPGLETRGARLKAPIPSFMALGLGLAWVLTFGITWATAPPPDPADPITATAYVLSMVYLVALMATAIGLGARQRWGLVASYGGGLLLLGAAAVCLAGGHSGAALFGQLTSGAFLTGITAGAWRATR